MSKFVEMMGHLKKMDEIKGNTTNFVLSKQTAAKAEIDRIATDSDLSESGKNRKRADIKKKHGEQFIKEVRVMRSEYDRASIQAKVAAEALLNSGQQKPSETTLATFNREFSMLKTELLLETNPESAMRKLKGFVEKQSDAYLANQIQGEFASIIGSVLDTAGSDKAKYKVELQRTLETVRDKSVSEEQKKAQQVYETMDAEWGRDLFLPNGIQYNAISSALGPEFARASNKPQYYRLEEEKDTAAE